MAKHRKNTGCAKPAALVLGLVVVGAVAVPMFWPEPPPPVPPATAAEVAAEDWQRRVEALPPVDSRPAVVDSSGCSTSTYGNAAAHVVEVGHYLQKSFKITNIVGRALDADPESDHSTGLALDFYFDDKDAGDAFARYVVNKRETLGIIYVIWWQRLNLDGEWVTIGDRGSQAANHYDHVHLSFASKAVDGAPRCEE
jgi:hypothetical protein